MKRIFKYELQIADSQKIKTHTCFEPISIEMQNQKPVMYAIVDDETPVQKVVLRTYGTGFQLDDYETRDNYIGTYMLIGGDLVYHVFKHIE